MADSKAADVTTATEAHGEDGRRGSLVVDHNLASEEDAAVLAKMG